MHKVTIHVEITSTELDGLFARIAPNPIWDDLEYDRLVEQLMKHLADLKIRLFLKRFDLKGRMILVPECKLFFDYFSNRASLDYFCTDDSDAVMLKLSEE